MCEVQGSNHGHGTFANGMHAMIYLSRDDRGTGDDFLLSIKPTMTAEESAPPPIASAPEMTSCRRKKSEDATFLQDVKDHIDEFINASTAEHKTCFQKTILKMFGMSKVVAKRNADDKKEVESSLPLRTVISE
ncbi:hypothetical protein OSB04_030568 [Centaurea solstitialis]|uniref:Uncharacterized protein n=1 Tax=Centaurea solstitialis TaxID=347529 RepID=A0AA38SKI7_9ASTR|nr:hypothetical protein OSB04_030568 [Centaurea solstitialis]